MAFKDVKKGITLDKSFSQKEKAKIWNAIEGAYEGSATARIMFDKIADESHAITIVDKNAFKAEVNGHKLYIGTSYLDNLRFINQYGKLETCDFQTALVHEFSHALNGLRDPKKADIVAGDYVGDNVRFENLVREELGLDPRLSYFNVVPKDFANSNPAGFKKGYTDGQKVDLIVVASQKAFDGPVDTTSKGSSRDLLMGHGKENNTLLGGGGDDFLYGFAGTDQLSGDDGNDFLFGGDGNDRLYGNEGEDHLHGDHSLNAYKAGSLKIGMQLPAVVVGEHELDLKAALKVLQVADGGITGKLKERGDGKDRLEGGAGDDLLFGGGNADLLIGGEGHDTLLGGNGADKLDGGEGDDFLSGGDDREKDRLVGGDGADTYLVYGSQDTIVELAGGGIDCALIAKSGSYTFSHVEIAALTSKIDKMSLIIQQLGEKSSSIPANLVVAGNDRNNTLTLKYNGVEELTAAFFGGGGKDTFHFNISNANYLDLSFEDFARGDRINIRNFGIDSVEKSGVIDVRDEPAPDGLYLLSDKVTIKYNVSVGGLPESRSAKVDEFFGTDADWVAVRVSGGMQVCIAELHGNISASQFMI